MIIVNVGRSWPKAQSERERIDAVEGGWPIRGSHLPPAEGWSDERVRNIVGDLHNEVMLDDVTRLRRSADYLVAVSSNVVVDVRAIHHQETFDVRIAFKTAAVEWAGGVVGLRLPSEISWRRGESWPIKAADTSWLREAVKTDVVTIGSYTLHLLPNGHLHVKLPPSAGIVTVGTHDQAVPVPTITRASVADPESAYSEHEAEDEAEIREWRERQAERLKVGGPA